MLYLLRSPINHADQLKRPMIFFQGLDDKVVPPQQSEVMVDALREAGVPVAYITLEGEGHGFRKADSIVRTLEAELYFYLRIFGIDVARGAGAGRDRQSAGSRMTTSSLQQQFDAFTDTQKLIAALLALAGEPMGKSRIVLHLAEMGIVIPATTLDDDMQAVASALGIVSESIGRGFAIAPDAVWPAIQTALDNDMFRAAVPGVREGQPAAQELGRLRRAAQLPPGRGAAAHGADRRRGRAHRRAAARGLPGLPRSGLPASAGRHLRAPVRAGDCSTASTRSCSDDVLAVLVANAQREPASAPAAARLSPSAYAAQAGRVDVRCAPRWPST